MEGKDLVISLIKKHLKILIVDDEVSILKALRRELHTQPYPVVLANKPEEALALAQQEEFALIISDNMMPRLTGLDLLSRIAKISPGTRRILLTGKTDLNEAIQAFNDGVIHRYIGKPWEKETLLSDAQKEINEYKNYKLQQYNLLFKQRIIQKKNKELEKTKKDLKQSQTQLNLHSDMQTPDELKLSLNLSYLSFLIVDPNQGVSDLLIEVLRQSGVDQITAVSTYDEALRTARKKPVDVILSETDLRTQNGLNLFKTIKNDEAHYGNPCMILTTTKEDRSELEQVIKVGIHGYIIKPFNLITLAAHIQQAIQKTSALKRGTISDQFNEHKDLVYLVAVKNLNQRQEIQHLLTLCGVKNVITVAEGQNAFRTLGEKSCHVLLYDTELDDPSFDRLQTVINQNKKIQIDPAVVIVKTDPSADNLQIKEFESINVSCDITSMQRTVIKAMDRKMTNLLQTVEDL